MNPGKFTVIKKSSECAARLGTLETAHGSINTPVFMPVGTQGTVKTISNEELHSCGAEIILGNSYHLYLRPGVEILEAAGGLAKFTGWNGPTLTDSGGFQIFSLKTLRRMNSEGVEFRSHIDGSKHFFTPEKSIEIQQKIGADIIMCFDECPPYPCTREYAKKAADLTVEWAKKCKETHERRGNGKQLLFGIIQGSVYDDLRLENARKTVEIDFPGYAFGGLSVGEPRDEMVSVLEKTACIIPQDKPRYLMGVGTPKDIFEAVERGIDMFDCVLPTRNGRNGQAITSFGKLNIQNAEFMKDFSPLDSRCGCPACSGYSRAYLNHLFRAQEILALRLLSLHNTYFMIKLLSQIRESLKNGSFMSFKDNFLSGYESGTFK